MTAYAKTPGGVWAPVKDGRPWEKNGGVFKSPKQAYAKDAGVWKPLLPPKVTFMSFSSFPGSGATTFSSGSIVFPENCLVVGALVSLGTNSRTVASMTVGAAAGTIHATSASNLCKSGIGSVEMPAGTYVVSMSLTGGTGSASDTGLGVWMITNYRSPTPVGAAGNVVTSTSVSVSFNAPRDGVALYGILINNHPSETWSNAVVDARDDGSISRDIIFASARNTPAASPRTETVSWSGSQNAALSGAAWS